MNSAEDQETHKEPEINSPVQGFVLPDENREGSVSEGEVSIYPDEVEEIEANTFFENLSNLFSNNSYLITFWIHFVAINLFTGGWIVKDSQKNSVNKILLILPLLTTYLIGPLGLFIYWLIRIFYAKNINLYE